MMGESCGLLRRANGVALVAAAPAVFELCGQRDIIWIGRLAGGYRPFFVLLSCVRDVRIQRISAPAILRAFDAMTNIAARSVRFMGDHLPSREAPPASRIPLQCVIMHRTQRNQKQKSAPLEPVATEH